MTLFSATLSAVTLFQGWAAIGIADTLLFGPMAVTGTLAMALITCAFRLGHGAADAPFDDTALI